MPDERLPSRLHGVRRREVIELDVLEGLGEPGDIMYEATYLYDAHTGEFVASRLPKQLSENAPAEHGWRRFTPPERIDLTKEA